MAIPGLSDLTWDSASCAHVILGSTRVAFTKFSSPKVETKTEKVRRVGESLASKRTPGASEVADFTSEILATDFEFQLLPAFGAHASNELEWTILASLSHPSVAGSFRVLVDGARIMSEEGPELNADEKGIVMKLGWSAMRVWRAGRDGRYKASARMAGLPSSAATALLSL